MPARRTAGLLIALTTLAPTGAAGADDVVTVHRDPWGVPHVLAASDELGGVQGPPPFKQ